MRRRLRVKLLRTAASKKVTLACFDPGAWTRLRVLNRNAGTTRKTTFVGPRFGVQNLDPKTGATSQSFITTDPIWGSEIRTPKWGPGGVVFLEPARFPKTVSASKSRSGLRRACPCPFCLVVTLLLADNFVFSRTGEAPLSATGFCADFLTSFWGPLE